MRKMIDFPRGLRYQEFVQYLFDQLSFMHTGFSATAEWTQLSFYSFILLQWCISCYHTCIMIKSTKVTHNAQLCSKPWPKKGSKPRLLSTLHACFLCCITSEYHPPIKHPCAILEKIKVLFPRAGRCGKKTWGKCLIRLSSCSKCECKGWM